MKFFVPQVATAQQQSSYEQIVESVRDQMRIKVAARKIYSLSYIHDKKRMRAMVGQPDPQRGRYEVIAILESKPYVVCTRQTNGGDGLTILVSNDEITEIEDFE